MHGWYLNLTRFRFEEYWHGRMVMWITESAIYQMAKGLGESRRIAECVLIMAKGRTILEPRPSRRNNVGRCKS